MGLLYLDPTLEYTDPAKSGCKVLDAGSPSWEKPDAGRLALDASNAWSAPELAKIVQPSEVGTCSWDDLASTADAAAKSPSSYRTFVGKERQFTLGGYNVTARIVGVAQDTLRNGGKCGFTFHVYKGLPTHDMNSSETSAGGYASTSMKTWLERLSFPSDLAALLQEFVVKYRSTPTGSASSLYAKVALLAASNIYWKNCASDRYSLSEYFYTDEGEPYQYFKDNDTDQARLHYRESNTNGFPGAWLLSPYNYRTFMTVGNDGVANYDTSTNAYVPSARFCLGSSI